MKAFLTAPWIRSLTNTYSGPRRSSLRRPGPSAHPPESMTLRVANTPDGAAAMLVGWEQEPGNPIRLAAISLYYSDRTKAVSMHRHGVALEIAKHMAADGSLREGLIAAGHKLILAAAGRDNPQRDVTTTLAALLDPVPDTDVQQELFALAMRARPLFDALRCCLGAGSLGECADSAAWWAEEVATAP